MSSEIGYPLGMDRLSLFELLDVLSDPDLSLDAIDEALSTKGGVIEPSGNGGRSALIECDDGSLLALFRGTGDPDEGRMASNVLDDLDANPVPFPSGIPGLLFCVHDGFLEHTAPHLAVMMERLRAVQDKGDRTMTCSGFSLGGAAAQIAAVVFAASGVYRSVHCTAFGMPRPFTPRAATRARRMLDGIELVRVAGDPIPMLPPVALGYRHVVRPVRIKRAKQTPLLRAHSRRAYLDAL